jgi:signal transduction histidine kinase
MVTAIDLYCDLLEEPGVLGQAHQHYAGELRLVSAASRRLLDKLARAGSAQTGNSASSSPASEVTESSAGLRLMPSSLSSSATPPVQTTPALTGAAARAALTSPHSKRPDRLRAFAFSQPVESLADELHSNRNLLSAMAGHGVTVGLSIHGGDRPLEMTREDLTRVLVNLARNAGEAMPGGGHLEIELEETAKSMTLAFTDSGPGIPPTALEAVFSPGYTTQPSHDPVQGDSAQGPQPAQWPAQHRGLGLAIVRSIAAASGGTVWAANRHDSGGDVAGAVLTLEFPIAAPS